MVFRQPTSSSLKQREQLTVSDWVRGVSPISVGFHPGVTIGALQALKKSIKLLVVPKLVLTNGEGKFSLKNSPSARITIVFWLFCIGSKLSPHRVYNVFNAATTGHDWIGLGST